MHKLNRAAHSSQSGYSLIQMAIGLMVVGIMMAYGGYAYSLYLKDRNITQTQSNVQNMVSTIQAYRQLYGRYPCPAAMNVARDDGAYGHETNCADTSVVPGDCDDGYCVETAVDGTSYLTSNGQTITLPDRAAALTNARVRVGAIPFRLLQIDEASTYDSYGSRLLYVMTESMASQATFQEAAGAIDIINEEGESLSTPPGAIPFLVLSTGPSKAGGYTRDGVPAVDCAGSAFDLENCKDFSVPTGGKEQAVYASTYKTDDTSGDDSFDDVIEYFAASVNPVWKRTTANLESIEALADDNVGVDVLNPTNAFQVPQSAVVDAGGTTQNGALRVTGQVKADLYCDENGANCFDPARIMSTNIADGIQCSTANEYMIGVQGGGTNGAALCDTVRFYCTNDAFPVLQGFNTLTGAPICVAKPLASCNSHVQICGAGGAFDIRTSGTLDRPVFKSGAHGLLTWIEDPSSYASNRAQAYFQCNNGSWVYKDSYKGLCSCSTPAVTTQIVKVACAGNGVDVDTGSTNGGEASQTWDAVNCKWNTTSTSYTKCVCGDPGTKPATGLGCPVGYNDGNRWQNYVFNNSPSVCAWQDGTIDNTCACKGSLFKPPTFHGDKKTIAATGGQTCQTQSGAGYTGQLWEEQVFDETPGQCKWKHSKYIKDDCACDTTTEWPGTDKHVCYLTCSTEISPEKYKYKYILDGTTCKKGDEYKVAEAVCSPKSFYWKQTSGEPVGPASGDSQGKPQVNDACTCAQKGTAGPTCYKKQTDGTYLFYACTCQ